MLTGIAKNIGACGLVILAIVVAVMIFSGGPATVTTTPVAASYPATPPIAASVATSEPTANCPSGAVASAPPGPIPSAASAGYMWTPANYPTTGWCEVAG
jgi:hypothetical protein